MMYNDINEYFNNDPAPVKHNSLKRRAAQYLGKCISDKLSKSDQRKLQAKAKKMKVSEKKAKRRFGMQLVKRLGFGVSEEQ